MTRVVMLSGGTGGAKLAHGFPQGLPAVRPARPAAGGVPSGLLPATDDRLRTRILTDDGDLEFQRYFVQRGQRDEVRGISFEGAAEARPTAAVLQALRE